MKILMLSPYIYGSAVGHGGGVVSFRQLVRLACTHEVHFLSFVSACGSDDAEEKCINELRHLCASVTLVPLKEVGRLKLKWSKIQHILRRVPLQALLIESEEMREQLRRLLDSINPDILFIQFPQMAQYVVECNNVPSVMDTIDVFSVSSYRVYQSEQHRRRKIQQYLNWLCWVRYEAHFYSLFSKIVTITDQDRVGLRIFSPGLDVDVIPAAIDVPTDILPRANAVNKRVGFAGSSSHPPNIDAVRFFLEEIFPLVRQNIPDVEFHIAGSGMPGIFEQYESEKVHILGFVEDIQTFFQSCQVFVVPLRFGGGVKIKTIEAMANGCPVVSTSIGVEETGAEDGVHALVADLPSEFAKKLIQLLHDPMAQEKLSRNARELAVNRFSMEARSERIEELLSVASGQSAQ